MGIIISSLTVGGIKNLKEPVTIDFMNYKADRTEGGTYKNPKAFKSVTAIYGPNGAGKSAIVHGLEIFQYIIRGTRFLIDFPKYTEALMNRKTNLISICVEYFIVNNKINKSDEKLEKYSYLLVLEKRDRLSDIVIKKEECLKLKPQKEVLFVIENGEITTCNLNEHIKSKIRNKLLTRSIADVLMYDLRYNQELEKHHLSDITRFLYPVGELVLNLSFHIEESDAHSKYLTPKTWNKMQISNDSVIDEISTAVDKNYFVVSQGNLGFFRKLIKNATKFMKLFKTDLENIETIEKVRGTEYLVSLEFFYQDGYKIDKELESSGIKKLFELFLVFENDLRQGKVLFIDELDSAINDVYLMKLIEYFADYCKGQIIFTTHNTSPMDMMNTQDRKDNCQILFLNSKPELVPWKQVGSFSPSSLYKKGQIKGLPFSLDAWDFIDIFKESK